MVSEGVSSVKMLLIPIISRGFKTLTTHLLCSNIKMVFF
jgi:hypothetical protein